MQRETNRSRAAWTHRSLAKCVSATLIGGLAAAQFGCDDASQRHALNAQSESNAARVAGIGATDAAVKSLQDVASSDSSTPTVIQTQQSLGQVQMFRAQAAAAELAQLQRQADALVFQIGERARAAQTSVTLAGNYAKLDPKANVAAIKDMAGKTRGDANALTVPDLGDAQVPTLAAAQQNKSRLEGEIAKTQAAIAAATGERDGLLADAGKASAELESQTGDARVTTAKQIADLRGKAAVAGRSVSDLSNALSRLQAEHLEAEGLVAQLQIAVDTLVAQGTSLDAGWQAVSASSQQQLALAKKLLEGGDDSVEALSKRLIAVQKDIDAKRGEVETEMKNAIAQLEKAAGNSSKFVGEVNGYKSQSRTAYEVAAWSRDASTMSPDRANLDKAAAERSLADLYAGQARAVANTLDVAPSVESASAALNIPVADPFNSDKLKTDLARAIAAASDTYTTANATLDNASLTDPNLAGYKPVKAMARIVTLADHAALADAAGQMAVAPDVAGKAKQLRADGKAAVAEAKENGTTLPPLPVSLGGSPPTTMPDAGKTSTTAPAAEASAGVSETSVSPAAAEADAGIAGAVAAMKHWSQLVDEGNVDALKAAGIAEAGADEEIQAQLTEQKQVTRFRKAMQDKFPNDADATALVGRLNEAINIAITNLRVDADKAFLGPTIEGEPETLRRADGVWKVVIAAPVTDEGKKVRAHGLERMESLGKISDDIEAGTASVADVTQRLTALIKIPDSAAPTDDAAGK